jgi:hypothetical protein
MGIDGVFQNAFLSLDNSKLILSFFEPKSRNSSINFITSEPIDKNSATFTQRTEESKSAQVLNFVETRNAIQVPSGLLVTVVAEYWPDMLALGLDEPGFLLIDCQKLDTNPKKAMTFVEDPIV